MDGKQLKGCHSWHNAVQPNNYKKKAIHNSKALVLNGFSTFMCCIYTDKKVLGSI